MHFCQAQSDADTVGPGCIFVAIQCGFKHQFLSDNRSCVFFFFSPTLILVKNLHSYSGVLVLQTALLISLDFFQKFTLATRGTKEKWPDQGNLCHLYLEPKGLTPAARGSSSGVERKLSAASEGKMSKGTRSFSRHKICFSLLIGSAFSGSI